MSPATMPRHIEGRGLARRLDLSGLYRSCIFRSAIRADSHPRLAQILDSDHEVQWGPGKVDSALFGIETRSLKLMVLRYGPQVAIRPQPFVGFSLVQMPLRGSMHVRYGREAMQVDVGQAVIIGQDDGVCLNWSEDCEQVILRVPHNMLGEVAQHPTFERGSMAVPKLMVQRLDDAASAGWVAHVQALLDSVLPSHGRPGSLQHPAWVDQMERSLALFTLLQMQMQKEGGRIEQASMALRPAVTACADPNFTHESGYRMEVVRRYVTGCLGAPLSLEDLAKAAGVRPRTIYMDCMRHHGVGPMTWLRGLRLDAARQQILNNPASNVTDVAMECGFGHLGRFAAYYRERFRELPSETAYGKRAQSC